MNTKLVSETAEGLRFGSGWRWGQRPRNAIYFCAFVQCAHFMIIVSVHTRNETMVNPNGAPFIEIVRLLGIHAFLSVNNSLRMAEGME